MRLSGFQKCERNCTSSREDEGAALAPSFVEVAAVGAGRAAAAAAPIVARVGGVEILLPPGFGEADAAAAMRAAASL